jgi:SAM-dependent methyltransferase
MRRLVTPELLDDDLGSPAEVAASLVDLRHINQWFGGTRTTIALLRRVANSCNKGELSLLEIGAGQGDVPMSAAKSLAKEGISLSVTLLDRLATHLPRNGARSVAGDALRLPFGDGSFDVVSCSLFAHHFSPENLKVLLVEALRASRCAVIVNDLVRSRLHLLMVYMGLPLFRSRITWNDAPASVRAAYTIDEMESVLAKVEARRNEVSRHFLFRMGVILWK